MERLTKRHGKHAVQIGSETRRHDVGWLRLAELEDLKEQGRLIELPCALDTEVYFIGQDSDGTYEIHSMNLCSYDQCANLGKGIGEWLYLDKEEVEAKLKELG